MRTRFFCARRCFSFFLLTAVLAVSMALAACGGNGDGPGGAGGAGGCGPGQVNRVGGGCCEAGELPLDDGRCLPAGMQENGCPAGEVPVDGGPVEEGSCRPAGVPPDMCGDGFEPDGEGGCDPILPAEPCPKGMMAIPGETECHEVAACGDGKWGDVPVEANTQFVDGSYGGEKGPSDGSELRPWLEIQEGIDAAEDGSIVAVTDGTYAEDLEIGGKAVRLHGRCPEMVELTGSSSGSAAVLIVEAADGTEVRGVAIRGDSFGVVSSGSKGVLLDQVWIHDTVGQGAHAENTYGETSLAIRRSLVEGVADAGIVLIGVSLELESSVVRDTAAGPDGNFGSGMELYADDVEQQRSTAQILASVLERNRQTGLSINGSDAAVERSIIRDTLPRAYDGRYGRGIDVSRDAATGFPGSIELTTSVVERNHDTAVFVAGSHVGMERSSVRETEGSELDEKSYGVGVAIADESASVVPSDGTIVDCAVSRNKGSGILVRSSNAEIRGTVIRETEPASSDPRLGIGLLITDSAPGGGKSSAVVSRCAILDNHAFGVAVTSSEVSIDGVRVAGTRASPGHGQSGYGLNLEIEPGSDFFVDVQGSVAANNECAGLLAAGQNITLQGVLVRDTVPCTFDGSFGSGIVVQPFGEPAEGRSNVSIRSSWAHRNSFTGITILGADAVIEATKVSEGATRDDGHWGRGIAVQFEPATGQIPKVTIHECAVNDNHEAGISVFGAEADIVATEVSRTRARPSEALYGDGIIAASEFVHTTAAVSGCLIADSERAGLSSFGAHVSIEETIFECNAMNLNGESYEDQPATLDDLGGNVCGCDDVTTQCQNEHLGLEAPDGIVTPIDHGEL